MNLDAQRVVLLAEDDEAMRYLLRGRLIREGLRVIDVEDGFELRDYLDLCRPGGDLSPPDLVITDVNMPGQTGPEAISEARYNTAPVVLISACCGPALQSFAAKIKAAAVFEKPFDLDLLMAAVRTAIGA